MLQSWKTVRIFISSTFRDMHAERDHLVKVVFPELRERCAKRQLHLVDVDLRWGVTEEEAEQKILEICLDEIERCRPFFIGLLGERYGWVPPRYEVPDEKHYDWVREFKPGHSITAMEIYHGVLCNPDMKMRAFFYFRDPAFLSEVAEEHMAVFLPESEDAAEKLKRLKDDIRKNYPVLDYSCAFGGIGEDGKVKPTGLDAFGKQVLEDLWSAIEMEYPVGPALQPDELAIERAYHEAFIEGRCQRFIGHRDLLEQMTAYADSENNVPLVITGVPGCGKSALIANFARAYATAHSDVFVLSHFIGVSPGSTDIRRTLLRLCHELAQRFGIADEIPEDYEKLRGMFSKFIEQAASQGKVLLILDALNQLDESYYAHTFNWLPYTLPKNLRLIVSTLEGDCLEALRSRRPAPSEITMGPLVPEDRKQIIRQTLWDYRKRLDERPEKDQMGLLLSKGESDNPLYLIVACEELRVFGEFEKVTERITSLPGDVPVLFEEVLDRLEHDHGKEMVKSALSLLACARHGLLETEMLELLRREGEEQLPRAVWARLYRSLQFYLRPPGDRGEGALDFFHRQLAKAVRQRYLKQEEEERAGHRRLAEYFRRKADPTGDATWKGNYPRGLSELPYHQTAGEMWQELEAIFCDLVFLEAKCKAGMTYDLVAEYSATLLAEGIPKEKRGVIEPFARFVRTRCHILVKRPDMLVQEAYNFMAFGPVSQRAEAVLQDTRRPRRPWLRILNRSAEASNECLRTIETDAFRISNALAVTPDDRYLITGNSDAVKVWDLERGECLKTLVGHKDGIAAIAVTPDGQLVVTGGYDETVKVWDLETGTCLKTLEGHTGWIKAVALTWDNRVVTVEENLIDGEVKLWDLETGVYLKTLKKYIGDVKAIAVAPHGHQAIIVGDFTIEDTDETIRLTEEYVVRWEREHETIEVWDLETGVCLKTLNGPKDVCALAVTPDGQRLVTGSRAETIKIWDLKTGACLKTLEGHEEGVETIAITSDGRRVITRSSDAVKVWDLETGECLNTLEERTELGFIHNAIAVTSEGDRVVTVSSDAIKVWNLETRACLKKNKKEGHISGVDVVAMTPDGRRAITGSYDSVKVWDLETRVCLKTLKKHLGRINTVVVMPDCCHAVTENDDLIVEVWDLETGKVVKRISDKKGKVFKLDSMWFKDPISNPIAITPDGHRSIARSNETVNVWDMETGMCLNTLKGHSNLITALAVTPDGRHAISCYESISIWHLDTGVCLKILGKHLDRINAVAVTPDGCYAVTGSEDGILKVWDLETGLCLKTLEGHKGSITTVAVVPNGRHVVTGSYDMTLKVWDIAKGNEIACYFGDTWISSCAVEAMGKRIIAGDHRGRVYFLALENIVSCPLIMTAWNSQTDQTNAFGCPLCHTWSEIPASTLGKEIPCPNCARPIKLNPFTISADWHPVAKAWRGEKD